MTAQYVGYISFQKHSNLKQKYLLTVSKDYFIVRNFCRNSSHFGEWCQSSKFSNDGRFIFANEISGFWLFLCVYVVYTWVCVEDGVGGGLGDHFSHGYFQGWYFLDYYLQGNVFSRGTMLDHHEFKVCYYRYEENTIAFSNKLLVNQFYR